MNHRSRPNSLRYCCSCGGGHFPTRVATGRRPKLSGIRIRPSLGGGILETGSGVHRRACRPHTFNGHASDFLRRDSDPTEFGGRDSGDGIRGSVAGPAALTPSVTLVAPIAGQVRHGGSSPPLWQLLHQQRVKSAKAGQVRHRDACCTNGGSSPPRRAKSAIMTLCCSTSGPSPPRRVKSAIVTLAAPKAGQVPPRRVKSAITALFFLRLGPTLASPSMGPALN